MFVRMLLGACLVSALLTPVQAQYGGHRDQKGPQFEPRKADGSILAVSGNLIQMQHNDNPLIVTIVPQQTVVHLNATAAPDYLKRGMCVEFTADLDEKGMGKAKVDQLTIFTPSEERTLGLFSAAPPSKKGEKKAGPIGGDPGIPAAADAKGGRKARAKPAAASGGGGDDLFSSGSFSAPSKPADIKLPATCMVRGKVTAIAHLDKLTLLAGKRRVIVDLEGSPQIDVELADISPALRGDRISVEGVGVKDKPGIFAKIVKIDCANQLSSGKKHIPRPEPAAKAEKAAPKSNAKKEDPGLDVSDKPEPKKAKAKEDELPNF